MFFKIGALKTFVIFTGRHLSWLLQAFFYRTLRWLLLDFRGSKYFFSGESGIYCGVSHRFLLRTPLKSRLKPQKQPLKLFCEKGVLRNFANFTGKHLCQSVFFNKVASIRPATLFKKRLWHRYFPVNFAKFLSISFLYNISEQLLPQYSITKLASHNFN